MITIVGLRDYAKCTDNIIWINYIAGEVKKGFNMIIQINSIIYWLKGIMD